MDFDKISTWIGFKHNYYVKQNKKIKCNLECIECGHLPNYQRLTSPRALEVYKRILKDLESQKVFSLIEDNSWSSDYIEYIFQCIKCNSKYKLSAETLHGIGGSLKKIVE